MEFGNNIKNLLYLYDCIIIPGLGGFVARYYPARVDGLRRKLKPPCKEFSFDDSLVKGGEIVISFIARVRGIEESQARTIVERFALETRAIVQQGDKAELPGLGWFIKGPKGKIHFEFDMVNNFHPETAGLPELNLPEFNKSDKTVMAEVSEPFTQEKHHSRLRQLAWLVPLLLLLAAGTYGYLKRDTIKNLPWVTGVLEKFSPAADDSDLQPGIVMGLPDSASAVDNAIDTISKLKNALNPATDGSQLTNKDPYANCTRFYLIAGSFKRMKNAQELSKKLSAQGFTTEILNSTDGMYRVSVKVFTRRTEALDALGKMKAEGKIGQVWLLSI
ncbi:MAG: SPOR domain-containing protein [Bacteroidales bacterium]